MVEARIGMIKVAPARGGALAAAALVAALIATFLVARAAQASPGARAHVVSTAKNASLGKTVLVNRGGLTLYSLNVERRGRFICTDSTCLTFWTPLVVPKGGRRRLARGGQARRVISGRAHTLSPVRASRGEQRVGGARFRRPM
jgi:predicted lipoprotein with Yx(FWY)xxD motif